MATNLSYTGMRMNSVRPAEPERKSGSSGSREVQRTALPEEYPKGRQSRRASIRTQGVAPLLSDDPGAAIFERIRTISSHALENDSESEMSDDAEYLLSGIKRSRDLERDSKQLFSNSQTFKMFAGIIIMANTVVIALEAIYIQQQFVTFDRLELAFTAFYTVELSWRMWERGIIEFLSTDDWWWSWFDLLITALSVVDTALSAYTGASSGASVGRLFRVFRILRMFRAMKFLHEVDYVLAQAALATLKLATIVALVLFVSSIIATNMLWDSTDPIVSSMFADLASSMWAMFKLMTLDDWVPVCDRVIKVKPGMLIFFVVFIFTTSIALISLVPAIFIELSLNARKREEELSLQRQDMHLRRDKKRLLHTLFKLTDHNQNGKVSVEEMKTVLTNDQYLRKLQDAGLTGPGELRDVRLGLFDLWEESFEESARVDFEISEEEFIDGLLRVRENVSQAVLWRCITATRLMLRDMAAHTRKELKKMEKQSGALEKDLKAFIKAATADILTSQEHIRHTVTSAIPTGLYKGASQESLVWSENSGSPLHFRGGPMGGPASVIHEEEGFCMPRGSTVASIPSNSTSAESHASEFGPVANLMKHLERQSSMESPAMGALLSEVSETKPQFPKFGSQSWDQSNSNRQSWEPTPAAPILKRANTHDKNRAGHVLFESRPQVGTYHKGTPSTSYMQDADNSYRTTENSSENNSSELGSGATAEDGDIDEESPFVPQDAPSAAMFESAGHTADAAFLL